MKEQRTCFVLRGYPACGKSTLAKQLSKEHNAVICSADDYWMTNGKYVFDASKLRLAHNQCFETFKSAISDGHNVVIDNTNLKYTDMCRYVDYCVTNNNLNKYVYKIEFIEVQYNDIEKAISYRTNSPIGKNIPEDKMRYMFKEFKRQVKGSLIRDYKGKISLGSLDDAETRLPFSLNTEDKFEAIVCDLDGTLALFEYTNGISLRNAFDASTCNQDIINVPVAMALKAFQKMGHDIIFLSGREEKYRAPTEEFLERVSEEYGISYHALYMRGLGDFRPDDIIKKEIYDNKIKNDFHVTAIFDDRPKVVRMWKSLGIWVFDCNYRGIEF